jgi:hypothetical protein
MSVQSFGKELKAFSKRTDVKLDVTVRKVALALFDGITEKNPVDTGRAKGNWNLSVGKMDQSVNDNATSTSLGRPGKAPNMKKGDGDKVIWITNSLPYINALEHGHSRKQAPRGMVSLTVNEVRASLL